jgi:nucleoside diphosphate kinase
MRYNINMSETLSYVLVTPYTVAKSRTGGIVGRLLLQSELDLVAARIFNPDSEFVGDYSTFLRQEALPNKVSFLADYVEANFAAVQGVRKTRALLLLFRGEDACKKLTSICGHMYSEHQNLNDAHGETIRDTYADLILAPDNPEKYIYFEPAVITPRSDNEAAASLRLFARFLKDKPNLVESSCAAELNSGAPVERTLVILKPDNWKVASSRPGAIIDMFSRTGLHIAGIKVHRFSLNQALEFYGDVLCALSKKLGPIFGVKGRELLETEFKIKFNDDKALEIENAFGQEYARDQFEQIVEFMSGYRPGTCPKGKEDSAGSVKCMILVYEGENAVQKIRDILGPTDPLKAPAGTVRREFGSNVMVNTAHASDSPESFKRESKIIKVDENTLVSIIEENIVAED